MRSIEDLKQASRELMEVSPRLLRTDGGTQYRVGIEEETMRDYLEAMKDGAVFPPIETVFDGQHHWVVDGFHRLAAHCRRGSPSIKVSCIHGTLEEARLLALGANTQHGLRRDAKTKRRIVEEAIQHPAFQDESNYAIAKFCGVSQPFVAAVRNPEAKVRQAANNERRILKMAGRIKDEAVPNANGISTGESLEKPTSDFGDAPSQEEIEAAEEAYKADQEMMYKILESDDALKMVVEENNRLNLRKAQLEVRLRGLMNEKNECIKLLKSKEREVERLRVRMRIHEPSRSEISNGAEVVARSELVASLRNTESA